MGVYPEGLSFNRRKVKVIRYLCKVNKGPLEGLVAHISTFEIESNSYNFVRVVKFHYPSVVNSDKYVCHIQGTCWNRIYDSFY